MKVNVIYCYDMIKSESCYDIGFYIGELGEEDCKVVKKLNIKIKKVPDDIGKKISKRFK